MLGCALDFGQLSDETVHLREQLLHRYAHFLEDREDDAFLVFEQGGHEVDGQGFGVAVVAGEAHGCLNRLS